MDVLIIGGTRYMGRIVVQRLLERGDKVTIFSRGTTQPEWWHQIEHIQGDREDRADFAAKLKGKSFDAVIDTQAYRKEDVESAIGAFDGNVGHYVIVSTGSVYLEGAVDFSKHCTFQESVVDWSSIDYTYPAGEDPIRRRQTTLREVAPRKQQGIPYTIVRIPAVMGWDDPTGRMWWWVQRALDGRGVVIPLENCGLFRTLYSADAAEAFIRVLDVPETVNQTYHIAMQEIMTIERWASLIWRAAGHEPQITYVPNEIIQKQSHLNAYAPPMSRSVSYLYNLSKAEREFGFSTTPVEEWIQTTVDWYREGYEGEDSEGYEYRENELRLAARWETQFEQFISGF